MPKPFPPEFGFLFGKDVQKEQEGPSACTEAAGLIPGGLVFVQDHGGGMYSPGGLGADGWAVGVEDSGAALESRHWWPFSASLSALVHSAAWGGGTPQTSDSRAPCLCLGSTSCVLWDTSLSSFEPLSLLSDKWGC